MTLRYLIIILWIISCLTTSANAKTHKHTKVTRSHHKAIHIAKATKAAPIKRSSATRANKTKKGPATVYGQSQLASALNNAINSFNSAGATIAVYVKSMKYGDSLYARNIYQSMVPASTMKIFTAEAALVYLRPEYRFATHLLTDAKSVRNGVLQGNLYIVLNGDPTLTYTDLLTLLTKLKEQQIQSIAGQVYIDDTAYDQRFFGPGWEDKDTKYCFAAPISASIINRNCLPFKMVSSQIPGFPAHIETSPKYFYPTIKNLVTTKNSRTNSCSLHLSTHLNEGLEIEGCMHSGRAWWLSYVVADVPEYNRALFTNLLKQLNINVRGSVIFGRAPQNIYLIALHASKPLPDLINDMLKKSDNIIAGTLFKKIGQLYTQRSGSWENGSAAVSQILSRKMGVDIKGLRLLDGSGLSASNLAKPAQMMQLLTFAYHHPTSDAFISALPIAGIDGTLKNRMGNIARKVKAKTGTISGVVSLAGYAVSADKEPLAFVIIINGTKSMTWRYKELEDQIATALTKYKR